MKCAACGYDEALPFLRLHSLVDKQGRNQVLYACPTCGTVRLENPTEGEVYNKYHGCNAHGAGIPTLTNLHWIKNCLQAMVRLAYIVSV